MLTLYYIAKRPMILTLTIISLISGRLRAMAEKMCQWCGFYLLPWLLQLPPDQKFRDRSPRNQSLDRGGLGHPRVCQPQTFKEITSSQGFKVKPIELQGLMSIKCSRPPEILLGENSSNFTREFLPKCEYMHTTNSY